MMVTDFGNYLSLVFILLNWKGVSPCLHNDLLHATYATCLFTPMYI